MEFTDGDARNLLYFLHKYATEFAPDLPVTVPALAEDLAMSMDVTPDEYEKMAQEVAHLWGF